MKTELLILLLLDVFNAGQTELRHHQERHPKDNITGYPRYSTAESRAEDHRVTEVTNFTLPDEILAVFAPPEPLDKFFPPSLEDSRHFHSTLSPLGLRPDEITGEKLGDTPHYPRRENKRSKPTNKFSGLETSTKSFVVEKSNFYFLNPAHKKIKRNEVTIGNSQTRNLSGGPTRNQSEKTVSENPTFAKGLLRADDYSGRHSNPNSLGTATDLGIPAAAEPLVALTDALEADDCVENVVEDFAVSDDLVAADALSDRNAAEKLTSELLDSNDGLDGMTDLMECLLEKHQTIASMCVTTVNKTDKSGMSQTVYRKGNELFVDQQSSGYLRFLSDKKSLWTPLFWNCLSKTWIFGYSFTAESESIRIEAAVYFNVEHINGTVDQCKPSFRQILKGGPKCDPITTECKPLPQTGFTVGGYKCECLEEFYLPANFQAGDMYFKGVELEKISTSMNTSQFKCLPCPEVCAGACTLSGICIVQKNQLLHKVLFVVQLLCMLIVYMLIVLVFVHRKCKTIASGMWTIMEMILLGSLFLYGSVIVLTLDPSPFLCLIEIWSREMGFVICYGAIILKLYRILIEFRTRKAHRWIIRDKDLLKYLFAMFIVMIGYMSAWTAMNFYLMEKEDYSMLTTGVTDMGFLFITCKSIWWDYVTEISEILILIFGIHLSYASRNATTQFRERCFLCISISVEALVSSIFYILRSFYWDTTMHPDLNLVTSFIRCHLSTTVVLLLLFIPKWWYQKVQLNKARVSRNYLMQESGRGPLEAFRSQDGIVATNSDVEGEISLADMNPEDIRAELKRLYTQLEVLKNKSIRFDNPHISKRRGGRKMAHRRFSLQKKGSREKALRHQTQRLSAKHTDVEVTEAEASRTPEDSVCSNEGPSIIINDGPSDIVYTTPKKGQT